MINKIKILFLDSLNALSFDSTLGEFIIAFMSLIGIIFGAIFVLGVIIMMIAVILDN